MNQLIKSRLVLPVAVPLLLMVVFTLGFVAFSAERGITSVTLGEITGKGFRLVNGKGEEIGFLGNHGQATSCLLIKERGDFRALLGIYDTGSTAMQLCGVAEYAIFLSTQKYIDYIDLKYNQVDSAISLARSKAGEGNYVLVNAMDDRQASIIFRNIPITEDVFYTQKGEAYFEILPAILAPDYSAKDEPNTGILAYKFGNHVHRDEFDHREMKFTTYSTTTEGSGSGPKGARE